MKEKDSHQKTFPAMGKWFYAFIATAVVLIGAIVAIIILALAPGNATPPPLSEGEETGIYYYDAALGEYLLTLNSGNKFTIAGPDLNKSGDYTVTENTVTLDFVRDEDGTAQATLQNDKLTLVYQGATLNFLKKVPYTVTFNTNGGSTLDNVTVINGKTVGKPNDPTKDGNVFLGWYADAELTQAFIFGTTPVYANTTVYAKWAATVAGQDEFVIDFDLGFDATAPAAVSTVGGKLVFNADYKDPTRDGYTFVGWFVSDYEDGSKLTYAATENMTLNANTTLYAVWSSNAATLKAPAVSVVGNTISWGVIEGATAYQVTITDSEGEVVYDGSVGTTTQSFDFAAAEAGDYEIKVVAKNASGAQSEVTVRNYRNKGLNRVSKFEIVGTTLIFNAVEKAEKYLITVDCGNDQHNHTLLDNGNSTYFNFANCLMQEGGIAFTVTAVAEGYASTVSETFYYVCNLDKVGDIVYDAATATFKWASVANASKYYVTISCGAHTHATVDNNTATTFCVANCTGEITISVIPASFGYNSPEATTSKITKVLPATPENIVVTDMMVTWDAAEGAKSYLIKIDGTSYNVNGTSYNLLDSGITFTTGSKHTVSVQAVGETENSLVSDTVEFSYLTMGKITYNKNTVYWAPVAGANKFEVRVNGEESVVVSGVNYAPVTLTKSGVNKIEVRPSGFGSDAEWASVEVTAYTVTYETRSLNGSVVEYVAMGDTMLLPQTFTYAGFDFDGWYNTPGAAEGNGSEYTETVFTATGDVTLYANWAPKSYNIEFVGIESNMSGVINGEKVKVTYTKDYVLPVMTTTDTVKSNFAGWYTGPGGTGTKLTDYLGKSVVPYNVINDSYAYPYFTSGLIFELKNDNTYAVKKGDDINTIPVVTIPAYYNNLPVTTILENGFYNCDYLVEIHIPDTIKLIGAGAFNSCDALVGFDVYPVETETPHEIFYSSYDGALIYKDVASGYTYIEVFPRAKKGAFTVPETVDAIRNRAFNYCKISSLTISKEVKILGDYAFSNCRSLKQIVFEEGRTNPVAVATNAFYGCYSVTYIKLPSLIKGLQEEAAFDVATLDYLTALETIEVEAVTGAYFSAVEGMLCNSLGDTILYCPKAYNGISGVLSIPKGITAIGEGTFRNRNVFTEIQIPNYVIEIGNSAFAGCRNVKKVTIEGQRTRDLTIGSLAFNGCTAVREVIFEGSGKDGVMDTGKTTINSSAFANLSELRTLTVEAGANIAEIGDSAFHSAIKLRTINISNDAVVTKIGSNAFAKCETLASFTIPASTESIGNYAFADCSFMSKVVFAPNGKNIEFGTYVFQNCVALSSVELPATVQRFDGSTFDGCYSLKTIVVDPANPYLTTKDGVLYNKNFTEIMFYPKGIDDPTLANLPWDKLTTIGNTVFKDNTNITSVSIPKTITGIGEHAFDGCVNLTQVTIATDGTALSIGEYAFANCQKLTSITLPSYVKEIAEGTFYVTPLTSFTIPADVTAIGTKAFMYTSIKNITIPAKVEVIGDGAFAYTKLETLEIADGTAGLAIGDFTDIDVSYDFESGVSSLMQTAKVFPIEYVGYDAIGVFTGTTLQSLHLPARVTSIGAFAFYNQTALEKVTIAENSNLTVIGDGAFYGSSITSIQLENTKLATVGDFAFSESKLTGVKFPNTLAMLEKYSFADIGVIDGLSFTPTFASVEFADGGTQDLTIRDQAFRNSCFTTISFPKNLTTCYDRILVASTDPTYGIYMPSFYRIFEGNFKLAEINVAEGNTRYASLGGVFYEKENGKLTTLIMCPPSKTGEYTIPNTVTVVSQRAFYMTQLTKITFEEFADGSENYGKPILEIGSGNTTNGAGNFAVFGGQKLSSGTLLTRSILSSYRSDIVKQRIYNSDYIKLSALTELNFPSHIKSVGTAAVYGIENNGFVINFNQASGQVEFGAAALRSNKGMVKLVLPKIGSLPDNTYGYVFGYNDNLTEIVFAEGSTFTTLPHSAFSSNKALQSITIPACVEVIDEYCFSYCSKLTEIKFEENSKLTAIGHYAFQYTPFTEFVIPDSVTYLGNYIFNNVTTLKKVTIGLGVTSVVNVSSNGVSTSPFTNCKSLEEFIVPTNHSTLKAVDGVLYDISGTIIYAFPTAKDPTGFELLPTVREIEAYAFAYYKGTSIELPETLTNIHAYAFYQSKLQSVVIPTGVTEIGNAAFYNSSSSKTLKSVTFAEGSKLTHIGSSAFYYAPIQEIDIPDGVATMGTNVFAYCGELKTVVLPAALTSIPGSTFSNCKKLENVTIQNNVEKIDGQAFAYTAKLKSVEIPASVTTMAHQVFYSATALETVTFAEGSRLTTISYEIFYKCTSLKEITFPEGLSSIGKELFGECTSLEFVDLSKTTITTLESDYYTTTVDGVSTRVYNGFFKGCKALKQVILPETLEVIDYNCFEGCAALESISIPAAVATIQDKAFDGCSSLAKVEFSDDSILTALGSDPQAESAIFRGTTSLTTIELPENLVTIGGNIFENSGLTEINLPGTLDTISTGAFKNCVGLTEVHIPGSVADVHAQAFMNCENIEILTIAEGVEFIGADAFSNCAKIKELVIPTSTLRMGGNPFANCSGLTSFKLADGNEGFVIDATGVLYDINMRSVIFYPSYVTSETYQMPNTVFELASSAFAGSKLKTVTISDNIKVIPDGCFNGSALLESVTIPLSVLSIGDEAFRNCAKLNDVKIPASCTSIGDYAFENCTSLKDFDFGTRNTKMDVGVSLFSGCTSLVDIALPDGLTAIPEYMFANTGVKNVVIPDTVTDLSGHGLFMNCAALESIVLPESYMGSLGAQAFYNCTSLKSIVIPDGVTTFESYETEGPRYTIWKSETFKNCTALESVTFGASLQDLGYNAFENCTSLKEADMSNTNLYLLGDYVFKNCTSLEKVALSLESYDLGCNTFEGCPNITGSIDVGYCWFYGGFFKGCTKIEEVHFVTRVDEFDNYNPETGELEGGGNFDGWTSEQKIFLDFANWEELFDSVYGFIDEDPGCFPFLGCQARVFDAEGNELIYDNEELFVVTQVISPEGEVLWSYE